LTRTLQVLLINVVANGLFYNPEMTIGLLHQHNLVERIFEKWIQLLDEKVKRLHDFKLSILALSALFYLPFETWPPSLQKELKVVYNTILKVIHQYAERKQELDEESDETSSSDDDEDDEDDEDPGNNDDLDLESSDTSSDDASSSDGDDEDEDENIGLNPIEKKALNLLRKYDDQESVDPNSIAESYVNRLDDDTSDLTDESSDEFDLDDDDDFDTLIDEIDEILFFLEALQAFSIRDDPVFNQLMNTLSEEEKKQFQELNLEANARQIKSQQRTQSPKK